ncbi:unnamed protein product [Toxocara canis]|uniref:ABC transporter domain-containing protein n=1 Tax=Toxocara canis TaxID=6265 RepID=A0A183U7B4_TOXCA|nr:unnamed protein product [Toxocara canis]
MTLISGNVTVNGRISYSAQEPWIQNMSIRENILHGSSYDEEFYKSVLNACALRKDIHVLPGGDMTQIGEKSRNAQGITLSNGQKLRINIARAAYQSADIFLLDDPFSSVDRRIANRIFVNLFGGVLHNKTTIFTTDALHLLKNVDRIIVVEG